MKTHAKSNPFAVIIAARKSATLEEEVVPAPVEVKITTAPTPKEPVLTVIKKPRKQTEMVTAITPVISSEPDSRLGGKGKRSDPTFKATTAYIPKELHTNASIALRLANGMRVDADKEDFSELLTRLLADWYKKQNYYKPNV